MEDVAEKNRTGITRREACLGIGGAAAALGLGGLKFAPSTPGVRPPGGQDEQRMAAECLRCQRCYEVCPHHVIAPAPLEHGVLVARTPEMRFSSDYCDFCKEANDGHPLCAQRCPTGALELPDDAKAEETIIGKAVLFRDLCLAYNLIGCRFCYDACPYDAMELDANDRPYLIPEKCNGCGACESVCVSLKSGSIAAGAKTRAIIVVTPDEFESIE